MPYPPVYAIGRHGSKGQLHPRDKTKRIRYEWNAFQHELISACFSGKYTDVIATTAVRTGKTGSGALYNRTQAMKNPGCNGIWLAQDLGWFKRVAKDACDQLFGHEAVWHGTEHTYTWPNGATLYVVTAERLRSFEGLTAAWGYIDEAQNLGFEAYQTLRPRISDPRATHPVVLITGLPVFNNWADAFAEADPLRRKHFTEVDTSVNGGNIHPDFIETLRATLTPEEFERRVKGKRPKPRGLVFSDWSPTLWMPAVEGQNGNIIDTKYKPGAPVYLSLDFGFNYPALIANMELESLGVDVWIKDMIDEGLSTESLAKRAAEVFVARKDKRPGDTRIVVDRLYCDPAGSSPQTATGLDDISQFKKAFPNLPIQYTYAARFRPRKAAVELMQRRVLTAAGKRRQLITAQMWEESIARRKGKGANARGIVHSILNTKYPTDRNGIVTSDEPIDHPVHGHHFDAWRYEAINRFGLTAASTFAVR